MKRSFKCKEVTLDEDMLPDDDPPPKKVHVNYKKLVVPTRMRSSYWKYFGFPAGEDGSMITKDIIVCVLCKGQMVYNRNTSNLKMHLGSRHRNVLTTLESGEEFEEGGQPRQDPFKNIDMADIEDDSSLKFFADPRNERSMIVAEDIYDPNISVIFPCKEDMPQYEPSKSSSEPIKINDAIMNFLITDLISPKIVEGKGFHNFVSTLTNKTHEIPNERKITESIIPNLYRRHKDNVSETISSISAQNISLSLEQWTCVDDALCISVYLHYLSNEEPVLNSKLLASISYSGNETTEHWSKYLDSLFNEWNLNVDSISAVLVAFDNEELEEALKSKDILLLPCFLFLMQNVCSEHCFKLPAVLELLEKCRSLIRYIQENKVDLAEDEDEFVDSDGDENDFVLSCDQPDMWLTTYYMLRGVLRRKRAIDNFLAIKHFENPLTITDWKTLHHLVKCLEPLKTVVLTLFEEKNPLISLIKPLIRQVCCNKFTANHCDSTLIKELKSNILTALNEAYEEEDMDSFIQVATKLDPRFKKFLQEDEENSEAQLVNLLSTLVNEHGLSYQTNNRSRPSGINVLFGNNSNEEKREPSHEGIVGMEISTYRSQSSALLEECPLEWWQGMSKKCPNLVRLANRYHCVPAITMLGSDFSLKNYVTFCSQRATLPVHLADSLLFLNVNKLLC
ncbi:hypothetical protein V9T40_004930 [Parthenolecanium corni]|uniref:BED-type domain-containing protein n=1 Tax=Parthenolecanium corni TaxID=536013 RepID=A0AAN9Y2I9_9HEMI